MLLLTIFLRHDQSKNLAEIRDHPHSPQVFRPEGRERSF